MSMSGRIFGRAETPAYALRPAIVGCGKMATNHLDRVLRLVPPARVALCDREIIKARLLGEMYNIPNVYDSLDALAEEFHPDICHIATPPATHKELAVTCMRSGSHVYIEKPVCLTSREFEEICQTATGHNRLLCVGHQKVFERQFEQIRRLVKSGKMGRIIHMHVYDSGPFLELEDRGLSKGWWSGFAGGMFLDLLPHVMSIFAEFADGLKLEHSFLRTDARNRASELHGFVSSGSSPVTCSFHISFSTRFDQNYLEIECENGIIVYNIRFRSWYTIKKSRLPELVGRLTTSYTTALKMVLAHSRSILSLLAGRYDPYEGTGEIIKRFYEAVSKNGESPTPMPTERSIVELCEATVQASFGGLDYEKKHSDAEAGDPQFEKADILVTGAAGFIGTHLVRGLLEEGKTVRAMVRRPVSEGHFGSGFPGTLQIVVGDLLDARFVNEACKGVESIFHLAAATKGDLFAQVEGTCIGTWNLLQAVKGHDIKRLVYLSSVSIFDQTNFPKEGTVDEGFALEAQPLKRGAYTYSKLRAEQMVRAFKAEHKLKTIILRPGTVWGPGSKQLLLETNFRLGDRVLVVIGSAVKRLPLIYVGNLIDALLKAGDADLPDDAEPMNIVDSDNPSQREYLATLESLEGNKCHALFIPVSYTLPVFWVAQKALEFMLKKPMNVCYQLKSKTNRASYLSENARALLGWEPRVPFQEGLRRYIDWAEAGEGRLRGTRASRPASIPRGWRQ